MQRVAIIGAGKGGLALVRVLKDNQNIKIIGVCDLDPLAPGIAEATRYGFRTYVDFHELIGESPCDLIINVTNSAAMDEELERIKPAGAEVVRGRAALLIWELTSAQQQLMEEAKHRVLELKDLYELGLKLSSSSDLREVYSTIIDYATMLTNTPAGSIALLDEKSGEMTLAAAKGFSNEFFKFNRWKLRQGGLTSHILNQDVPIVIPDVNSLKEPVNPSLAGEGVKSLIATPLTVRGKIVGILYVDDFVSRDFSVDDASVLGLLAGYAALSIEKMKLLDDTKKMAITDGLTGLRNQQEFLRRLEEETSRAGRYERPLSIVASDIDYFKKYNDKFGHLAGNELLKLIARTLTDNCRTTDLAARTGGEEFTVIMPETDFLEAVKLAERLRNIVENLRQTEASLEIDLHVTISIGVAAFPKHGKTAMQLYEAADQALYKAKEAGRNRVIGFPDQTSSALLA